MCLSGNYSLTKFVVNSGDHGAENLRSWQTSSVVRLNPHTSQAEAIQDTDSCLQFELANMFNRRISEFISIRFLEHHQYSLIVC